MSSHISNVPNLSIIQLYQDVQTGACNRIELHEIRQWTERVNYLVDVMAQAEANHRLHALFVQQGNTWIPLWDTVHHWHPDAANYLSDNYLS